MSSSSISFIIPVLNERDSVAHLLEYLAEHYRGSERIVVDGGSSDDTVARALPLSSALLTGPPGRARQMNLGASAACADYVVFLHVDSQPTVSHVQLSEALSKSPRWGFCHAQLSGERQVFRVIERGMNLRSRLTRVATGDQMIFVQRRLLERIGGFADIPLMEDVELCKRLRRLGPPHIIQQPVITSSRRWETRGVARTVAEMWLLRLAYVLGVSPQRLWAHYYGR